MIRAELKVATWSHWDYRSVFSNADIPIFMVNMVKIDPFIWILHNSWPFICRCNIQGSVVSANVHINEKCELKDCIVGTEQNIQANSKYTISSNIWQVHVLVLGSKVFVK